MNVHGYLPGLVIKTSRARINCRCGVVSTSKVIWASSRENLSSGFLTKRFKQVFLATETSYKIDILQIASLDMIVLKGV